MTNPSPDLLKMLVTCAILATLAGCDGDAKQKAEAMTTFMEGCAVPAGGVLALSNWNNTITLTCTAFKPNAKGTTNGK